MSTSAVSEIGRPKPVPAWSKVDFIHTGPGTLAGVYLRRFWHPIYEAAKLPAGKAVGVRIMCEDFTLFRGESGAP